MSAVGTLLANRYRLERLLGSGASAHVYAATDELLQLPVAIKILHDSSDAERQIREATLAMSLNHSAIVRCHGSFVDGTARFIVMELAEGETLAERALRKPLTIDETIAVLRTVAEALQHAHEQGVLHRDIAPANILTVEKEGRVIGARVIDFGVAKQISSSAPSTQTVGLGTAAYAAPEQLAGHPTPQSDLFGLGGLLAFMLTGTPPVLAGGSLGRSLPSATPTWLARLLSELLAVDINRRTANAAAVIDSISLAQRKPGAQFNLGHRRRLTTIGALIALSLITFIILLNGPPTTRDAVARLCSWMEDRQLILWKNHTVVRNMALAASSQEDLAVLDRIFEPRRLTSIGREQLLYDCLERALHHKRLASIERLISLGASVRLENRDLLRRIFEHTVIGGSPDVLHLLMKHGFPIRVVFDEFRPFSLTAERQTKELFSALLMLLDGLPGRPTSQDLPLWAALMCKRPESFIPLVVARGPRIINTQSADGEHVLIRLVQKAWIPRLQRLLEIPGLDLEQPAKDGSTALIFAVSIFPEQTAATKEQRLETITLLLDRGANVNARSNFGNRPLLIAAELQLLEVAKLLLQRPKIEVNAQDVRGDTALHRALKPMKDFTPELVTLLISHGADLTLPNAAGETPRQLARRMGREQLLGAPMSKHPPWLQE